MNAARRILLTNDDGYTSEGLQVLADELSSLGEVWIVAPNSEQSAVSHALTMDRPLRMERLGERRWVVDGTPTDCVTLGVAHLMAGAPPSLVVSGINFGVNMGADVHYSGTVSAAFEGVILGFPALAVSQKIGDGFAFSRAASLGCEIAAWILDHGMPEGTLLNLNLPVAPPRGVRLTRLGHRRYTEGVIEMVDPRGKQIFWIGGGEPIWSAAEGTDFHELAEGYATVTPLGLDMTDLRLLDELVQGRPDWLREG